MKKEVLLFFSVLLLVGIICVCCRSNEEITANYHVLDKNGQVTPVFNYGDEILFELIVTNSTNYTLKFEDWRMLVRDAFIVYNSEGQMFNPIPNSVLIMNPVTIEPGEQFCRQLIWPWAIVPLPSGKYYSICTLNVDEKSNNIYTVNFEIK